ncbi:TIGR00270 family protein [Candidatus Woesearchaeota archaeon]|nr:TIGR00270 family protein [Candidatus Woesearchaeota archaeon]
MLCELCGKPDAVVECVVEGISMKVCVQCKKFGRVVGRVREKLPELVPKKSVFDDAPAELIVIDYGKRIKNARERSNKTQDEFAQMINEKVSLLRKMEAGQFELPLETARKMERLLRIQLVEKDESSKVKMLHEHKKSEGFTIGDIIKLKGKKNA